MANKGGTAETIAFSSFYIRTKTLFYLLSANFFCAKAKRQLQIVSVCESEASATITPRRN
ncbi:hypothetical protein [Bacillus sp. RS11]|uniref:hypothetical protein n=1 Tax=Lysinibacillus sp. RS11 TaxID=3242682 RepID=UPI0035C678F0